MMHFRFVDKKDPWRAVRPEEIAQILMDNKVREEHVNEVISETVAVGAYICEITKTETLKKGHFKLFANMVAETAPDKMDRLKIIENVLFGHGYLFKIKEFPDEQQN